METKFITFAEIPLYDDFKYQGKRFNKTSESRGVSQGESIKHRTYYEFDPRCPVEKLNSVIH